MESQRFEHEHPLLFNEDASSNEQSEAAHCWRCGEVMSGPSFRCAEPECKFYLHKECAEAPLQITHPFHPDHPLLLLSNPPAEPEYEGGSFICNFCGEEGQNFVYHCSCNIDLHIKCALFTCNFAQRNFGDLECIAYKDPSLHTDNSSNELESCKCFACWEPLFDSAYCSLDRGFNLHKKCVELPFEIDYPHHSEHLLLLQFSARNLPCIKCNDTEGAGLCYCCSLCDFAIHIACLSPPSVIEGRGHQHPFTLFFRQMPFTCDACGVEGNSVPYMCSNCNLLVHRKCISLPHIIKFIMHEHPLFHNHSIRRDESKDWDCVYCLEEVNTKHGSYYCSECHFILHVTCATMEEEMYHEIESVEKFYENRELCEDSYTVIERNECEEGILIKHFTHEHNLVLSDKILKDDEFCYGCTLLILNSFYHCSECCVFQCDWCLHVCNGFGYKCQVCGEHYCLRCMTPYRLTFEGHEHPVYYKFNLNGSCIGCGEGGCQMICKICKITLSYQCCQLPSKVRDKCDEHLLVLTNKDDNAYSEHNFCDICEKARNPNEWFYSCATCDTSTHLDCIVGVGLYSFIKSGEIYKEGKHLHPLRFVKKKYYYPECFECRLPCQRLALECTEPGCKYIVHWECVCPSDLREE